MRYAQFEPPAYRFVLNSATVVDSTTHKALNPANLRNQAPVRRRFFASAHRLFHFLGAANAVK
jgi:hypothetical protein